MRGPLEGIFDQAVSLDAVSSCQTFDELSHLIDDISLVCLADGLNVGDEEARSVIRNVGAFAPFVLLLLLKLKRILEI